MKTVYFQFDADGVPTDVTSVVLQDPTSTYGVKRNDTNAVVVNSGTALIRDSAGRYHKDFNEPATGLEYTAYLTYVYLGETYQVPDILEATTGPDPTSPWFTYAQFCNRFGLKNVATASNKDNAATDPNLAAIQDAFDEAVEAIQDELRGGPYQVPLDFTPNAENCPWKVRVWAMTVAYGALYIGGRGLQQKRVDPVGDSISKLVANCYREIGFVKAGLLQLNLKAATTTSGQAVTQGISAIGQRHRLWDRFGLDSVPSRTC